VSLADALHTAGKDLAQEAHPLVRNGRKLIPSVTRVFSRARELFVYLQAYDLAAPAPQPLLAYLTFYQDGRKVFETRPRQFDEVSNPALKTTPIHFSLPLKNLPPGRYDCQLTLLNPTARKAAFYQAPLLLVP